MNKEKLLLFPFDRDSFHIVKQIESMDRYVIEKVVAPKSYAFGGDDIGSMQNRENFGYCIDNSFEFALDSCDTVLLLNYSEKIRPYVFKNLSLAIAKKKKIILLFEPDDALKQLLCDKNASIIETNKGYFDYGLCDSEDLFIETPVVFVGGAFPVGSTKEIAVDLTNSFKRKGYTTATAYSDKNFLFDEGYYRIPDFLFDDRCGELRKIEELQRWICALERDRKPHVIIIAVPSAMMSMSDSMNTGYGIYPFLTSAAIKPDYFILDIGCVFNKKIYEMIGNHFLHKYGYEVNYIVKTNLSIDIKGSQFAREIRSNYLSLQVLRTRIQSHEDFAEENEVCIFDECYMDRICENIVEKLSCGEND